MDPNCFDDHIRSLTENVSRRGFLRSLLAATLGMTSARAPGVAIAKKRKKPLRFNEFGCINVGKPCRGRDELCCSGICAGKKPKKGKKDTRRCVGHDAQGCPAGQQTFGCGGTTIITCTTSTGAPGSCRLTTGNAGYCAGSAVTADCTHDTECEPGLGAGAACLACPGSSPTGTLCAGLNPAG